MHLQFIDNNSEPCRATRRRIRIHAAKEKNLGRTIIRPSKKNLLSQKRQVVRVLPFRAFLPRIASSSSSSSSSSSPESEHGVTVTIERQIGDGLSVLSFPADLSQEPRELVHKAIYLFGRVHFMPELCKAFEIHKGPPSMWFRLVLEDEAYFHIFVAMSVVSFDSTPVEKDDALLAVRHLNQAIFMTNQRLSSTDAVSDASMAVVVMMAQYERQRERYTKGLAHIDGLRVMVDMRGGISQLARDKPSLCQKIIRLDLDYALYLGTATRFSLVDVTDACETWSWFRDSFETEYKHKLPGFGYLDNSSSELERLAIDMTYLAWLLNDANAGRHPALNIRAFHGTLLLLGYHLIDLSPLSGPRPDCHLENAIHLGLVAFLMPFMYRYDGKVPDSPLLSQLIRLAVQQTLSADPTTQEILLWILLTGAASIFKQPSDEWISPLVKQMTSNLDLHTWEDVSRVMSKYPWTDAYHHDPGRALFKELGLGDRPLIATRPGHDTISPSLIIYTDSDGRSLR